MRGGRRLWLLLLIPAAALILLLLVPGGSADRRLPALTLERVEGAPLDLAELSGKPLVVNLWATWCVPCRREMPLLARAAREEPEVTFLFADQGESREAALEFLREVPGIDLTSVLLDRRMALAVEFETLGLPVTLFFDSSGAHVHTHSGEVLEPELRDYLRDLKAGRLKPT